MITLYKRHKHSIGIWHIYREFNTIKIQHATKLDGQLVRHEEHVTAGLQGRSIRQQIDHRIQSRVNKQLDKGYTKSLEEAHRKPTNTMGFPQPMLATQQKNAKDLVTSVCYQPKLDGHRCLITKQDGEVIAYTRVGKPIPSIHHITDELQTVIKEGQTLDGELYIHGTLLQDIGSLIKKEQAGTKRLQYWVYDTLQEDPFIERFSGLKILIQDLKYTKLTPTSTRYTDNLPALLRRMIDRGYEGLMVRTGSLGYETGRRSQSLIKVKAFLDGEFTVVDVTPSKERWGVLVCELGTPGGNHLFKVSAPGTHEEKRYILDNKSDYIGKRVTVEYSMLTKGGVPFHPVALRFREDI